MKFTHYDLKHRQQGEIVEITLEGHAANVLLLDSTNLQRYKNRHQYQYFGGRMTQSVCQLPIPRTGNWHVVVDLGGAAGQVSSRIRIL